MTIRLRLGMLALGAAAALPGCSKSSPSPTAPSTTYENVAGAYKGPVTGLSQGISLNATFSLNLQQSGGTLSGDHSIMGQLSDGTGQTTTLQGTGTISVGTVASGPNPAVSVTVRSMQCPGLTSTWSGSYNGSSGVLTLAGTVHVISSACVEVLAFPGTTIALSR